MAAPKNSNYGGWFKDLENGTLDIYYGEGGASDPVEIARVDTSGMTVVTGDLGLAAGTIHLQDGDTKTQATNKGTGVTMNSNSGQVTMHAAQLNDDTEISFVVTNSNVAATDVVIVNHGSAGTMGAYVVQASNIGAGSFEISVKNVSGGNLSEAIVINFAVIKGASS
jgi:hypothetical protein|tara:strand:- start:258 stop:758 length:501 start_codon:yes stop_codon:yes gene_type:complete